MVSDGLSLLMGIIPQFLIYGDFEGAAPFGSGHINDTFVSRWNQAGIRVRYLHQRINSRIFLHPDQVMENIQRVTSHIEAKLQAAGTPDRSRRTMTVVPGWDGRPWVRDGEGGWWRTYLFIEATHAKEFAVTAEEAAFLGKSVGNFQKQLADIPPPRLYETIPDFHNMESRYRRFYDALGKDVLNRVQNVKTEIVFMEENEERGCLLVRALREGRLPERICHNDTKMNNILIDNESGEALCLADLDTVMPGTVLFDLGDLIRSVTAGAAEDEQDLSRVHFDLAFFRAILEGYLSEASEFLVHGEKKLLTEAGRAMTQIMALRFLTDYLEGDHYYHIARKDHNLDRCRNQLALIKSMDSNWEKAERICAGLV
ncbi:MAG: aminoglycoside phosphotransferase family protein [Treponema sp.]|jgi:Ser/Thr protein kinase RdoA (MazF antagonist)|nr:aminoglycoside phosphotransferase family protein [Treponema sp.]